MSNSDVAISNPRFRSRLAQVLLFASIAVTSAGMPVLGQSGDPAGVSLWPQRSGPSSDFALPSDALEPFEDLQVSQIWSFDHGGGNSGIVGDRNTIYTLVRARDTEELWARSTASGQLLWKAVNQAKIPDYVAPSYGVGPHSTPALSETFVVSAGSFGHLAVHHRDSGVMAWSTNLLTLGGTRLERGYAASPLIVQNRLIVLVGGETQAIVAFDLASGRRLWSAGSGAIGYASPVLMTLAGVDQIVSLLQNEIISVSLSGQLLWALPINSRRLAITATPTQVDSNRLLIVTRDDGELLEVNAQSVEPSAPPTLAVSRIWSGAPIGSQVSNIIVHNGVAFGTHGSSAANFQAAVDLTTGERLWRDRAIGNAFAVRDNESVLFLSEDGSVGLGSIRPDGLHLRASRQLIRGRAWTPPTLVGPILVVRSDRQLAAFRANE